MTRPLRLAVSDSTPLIYLAKIGRLDLIRDVFQEIYIPEAVYDEVVTRGKALNIPDASIVENAVGTWIIEERIEPETDAVLRFLDTNARLGAGEKEALKLCRQLDATHLIADDREARRVARILNITPIGTCGIAVQAFRQGAISKREALRTIDDLVKAGFRISPTVYRRILDELEISP